MAKVRVELNREGVRQFLRSGEMRNMLHGHAVRIASSSGGEAETYIAETRAVAEVRGDDGNNSLLKSL